MRIVVPVPDAPYYRWQVLAQVQHLRERDQLDRADWLFYYQGSEPSAELQTMQSVTGARFHAWRDPGVAYPYRPALKPWLLSQFLEKESAPYAIHYLDPDVMLLKDEGFYLSRQLWSGSPTDSYTGPAYLKSHGEDLWLDLCALAGVDPAKAEQVQGAGAQWVLTGANPDFWHRVADLSVSIWERCKAQPKRGDQQHPVQAWCAEMYATHLGALGHGFDAHPDPAMDFVWARDDASKLDTAAYFHNAGVPAPDGLNFCKIEHQRAPWPNLQDYPNSASQIYVDLLRRTQKAYPKLTDLLSRGA